MKSTTIMAVWPIVAHDEIAPLPNFFLTGVIPQTRRAVPGVILIDALAIDVHRTVFDSHVLPRKPYHALDQVFTRIFARRKDNDISAFNVVEGLENDDSLAVGKSLLHTPALDLVRFRHVSLDS